MFTSKIYLHSNLQTDVGYHSLVKLTHKINHHTGQDKFFYDVITLVPIISPYSQISKHDLKPLYKVLNGSLVINQ